MVVMPRPVEFDENDPRPMLRYLDAWARRALASPESWGSTLERCGQWADYSARNQVLLASYGVAGPVAGSATWERIASAETGRMCAVRAGEHGLPVRVPVVGAGEGPSDRSRRGARSDSAVVGGHRWEHVFALEQLARRPAANALVPPVVPRLSNRDWVETTRLASGRMVGRTPRRVDDPTAQLAALAGKVPLGPGRLRMGDDLRAQAGWLVADRVGRADMPMPAFDPSLLSAREKWKTLVDVRHAAGQVLSAVSFAVGTDLCAPPVPRHDLVDDRDVTPGRRNYLAPADVRSLPIGVWVEAGPYSRAEWLARGVAGANGVGAFLRVNDRSYLAAYEARSGAMWRLETTGRGAHHGLVAEGTADHLTAAKTAARSALTERFPDIARAVEAPGNTGVVSPLHGWVAIPGSPDGRAEQRVFDERVAAAVAPGPGGRWQTWATVDGDLRQGPLTRTATAARATAEDLARAALLELANHTPDRADAAIRERASGEGTWRREDLVAIVGHRLTETDRATLQVTTSPQRLSELMVDCGVLSPSTMLRVLHAEWVVQDHTLPLVPLLGLPVADAIRDLHDLWGADRLETGRALGATTDELRQAGCTPVEMLAASPREELRRLDTREHTWTLAAPALLEAGNTVAQAVEHLAAHAPTPACFAAGVTTIVDSPVDAFALAPRRTEVADLVALSERYGLSPEQTATVMGAAGVDARCVGEVLLARCDGDVEIVTALVDRFAAQPTLATNAQDVDLPIHITDDDSLLAALGPPDATDTSGLDWDSLDAALQAACEAPVVEVDL